MVNKFKVKAKDGKETHLRLSVRAFDENSEFAMVEDGMIILTCMSEEDLGNLTSIKSLRLISD